MDIDKLVKGIQIIVKDEVKNELPKIVKEVVKRQIKPLQKENKQLRKKIELLEIQERPASKKSFIDEDQVAEPNTGGRQFSSNPILNEVLSETAQSYTPNSSNAASQEPQQNQQMLNEASGNSEDMEEWPTMKHNMRPQPNQDSDLVKQNMRSNMADKLGYGDIAGPNPNGLGVQTGHESVDKALNRDYSDLVKAMDKKTKEGNNPAKSRSGW